jgi:hypothetical protein
LPPGLTVFLVFKAPIDTAVAAAGDVISATVAEPVYTGRQGKDAVVLPGSTVTGRIIRMAYQRNPEPAFLIFVAFDALEANGAVSPFYAKLVFPKTAESEKPPGNRNMMLTGHGLKDWPLGMFGFRAPRDGHLVVRVPFKSKWLTTAPAK